MSWQQMHDGLFWPRDVLLPGYLEFKCYVSMVAAIEDYNAIQERLSVLRSDEELRNFQEYMLMGQPK